MIDEFQLLTLTSIYKKEANRAIFESLKTSFLIATLCAFYNWQCMDFLSDRFFSAHHGVKYGVWCFFAFCSLMFSGRVCFDIAKEILIKRVRWRWVSPFFDGRSAPTEWERAVSKEIDALKPYPWSNHFIVQIVVIVSVLSGAVIFIHDIDAHPLRLLLPFAAYAYVAWSYHYGDK